VLVFFVFPVEDTVFIAACYIIIIIIIIIIFIAGVIIAVVISCVVITFYIKTEVDVTLLAWPTISGLQ